MELVIGRVGRAHGVRGEVSVAVRTDQPEERFAVGAVVLARDNSAATGGDRLTVSSARWHGPRLLLAFEGVVDRTGAEGLRGRLLIVDADPGERTEDPDDFYDHQLIGLSVRVPDGAPVGTVEEVIHLPMQDLLSVRRPDGSEVLVPFVRDIVPDVDLSGGHATIDPPAGLLDGD